MKKIFTLLLLTFSLFSLAEFRIHLPKKSDLPSSNYKHGEIFINSSGDPAVFGTDDQEYLIFKERRKTKTQYPAITSRPISNTGTVEDIFYIGPGKIYINNTSYENTVTINCVASAVGLGGRISGLVWNAAPVAVVYLVPDPSPTSTRKFNCILSDVQTGVSGYDWLRVAVFYKNYDSGASRYRNFFTITANQVTRRNIFYYGNALYLNSLITTSLGYLNRSSSCQTLNGALDDFLEDRKVSFYLVNGDFTNLALYSDSTCTDKMYEFTSLAGGYYESAIMPKLIKNAGTVWPVYYKGTLNAANLGTPTTLSYFIYEYENIVISNKDL